MMIHARLKNKAGKGKGSVGGRAEILNGWPRRASPETSELKSKENKGVPSGYLEEERCRQKVQQEAKPWDRTFPGLSE